MTRLFLDKTKEEEADVLAAFLPGGPPFEAGFFDGTNTRKLLLGMAFEMFRVDRLMNDISEQHDITIATDFIEEWERAVGIPDHCFEGGGTLEQRRKNVLLKFAQMHAQTLADYQRIIDALGFTAVIVPAGEVAIFPLSFPIEFFPNPQQARFTIIVYLSTNNAVFPLPFPINFASEINNTLICVLRTISPANVEVIFRFGVSI